MRLIRPPRLRPADTLRVVAGSGPVPKDRFEAGVFALGGRYRLNYDPAVLYDKQGYLAGSDEQRLLAVNAALADPDCRAVVMARGGYGFLRILPFIDVEALRRHPKPFVGFSDGTAMLALCARAGVAAVHAPGITQLGELPLEDREAWMAMLEDPRPRVLLENLEDLVPGRVQGPLLGGNLEVLSRLLGTPFLPELDGAILFLEDVGERPYRIDRLLAHLDLAGVFTRVAAVVLGDFTRCEEPLDGIAESPSSRDVLVDRLGRLAIPVVLGGRFGHGDHNTPLPYGVMCELDTRYGVLAAMEGAVS